MVLVEYVPLDDLRPYPGNPRKISAKGLEKLKRSLQEFGFINPIIAQLLNVEVNWISATQYGKCEVVCSGSLAGRRLNGTYHVHQL